MVPSHQFEGTQRFEIVRLLGAGGMGEVYEAFDRELEVRVALKVLRWRDPRFLHRFKREFRVLQGLAHPNLATLGQLHDTERDWFFTMELVEGVDFLRHVWNLGPAPAAAIDVAVTLSQATHTHPFPLETSPTEARAPGRVHAGCDEARLREALRQLVIALVFLHGAGKVHRDIKPSNVMVGHDGRVVLLDFGLVTDVALHLQSGTGDIVGTPAYMAPEQASSRPVDAAADCYALGVLLYEALTGRLPFEGAPAEVLIQKLSAPAPDPAAIALDAPADLAALARALLEADPRRRATAATALAVLTGHRVDAHPSVTTRPPPFCGRERELVTLEGLVGRAARTAPRVVHLVGESGVGKSALIAAFFARTGDDVLSLSGRCYEREMTHYRAFDGVVEAIARRLGALGADAAAGFAPADAALLARMFPVLGGLPAFAGAQRRRQASAAEHDARIRAAGAFRELLHALARRWTVAIAIDDVQWADRDSLRLLADLLRAPDPPPVAWILGSRPFAGDGGQEPAPAWLAAALGVPLEPLALAPLDPASALELARALMGGDGAAEAAQAIAREAAGHPLYIAELVRHAAEVGAAPTDAHAPRLDDAIAHRLARLPEATQQIARLLAVAGAPLRPAVLRRAAAASPDEVQRSLAVLRLSNLARRSGVADDELVETYHDRVREALVARLSDDERRALHERLAAAMTAAGEPPELLLRHLEGAGNAARAAEVAAQAAERASAQMAYDRAAELYRTAIELGSHSGDSLRRLLLRLGEELVNAGHGRDAAQVFGKAADGADPETRLECRRKAAEQLLISGWIDEGLEAIAVLLDEVATALPRTPRRAFVSLVWNRLRVALRGRRWRLRRDAQIAREDLVRLDVYKAVSHGLSMVDNIRGADFNARYLRLALRAGEPVRLCRAIGTEAIFLGSQGGRQLARARALVAELERLEGAVQEPTFVRAWASGVSGALSYFDGRFGDATRQLRAGEALFRTLRVLEGWELNNLRLFQSFALICSGNVAELAPRYAQWSAEAEERGDRYVATVLRRRCGVLWLAKGDVDGALAALSHARWVPPEGRFHLQHWYEVQARGEAALVGGGAAGLAPQIEDGIVRLREAMLGRVQTIRIPAAWLCARLHLASEGGGEPALRRAEQLARALRRERFPYGRVVSGLVDAGVAARRGDRDAAAGHLRAVIAQADDDTRVYGAVARARLAGLVGGDEGAAHATVAAEIAAGLGIASLRSMVALCAPGFGDA